MIVGIFYAVNSLYLRQNLSDSVFKTLGSAKYKLENVVSYEEFLRMKAFISRIKKNTQIRKILQEDPSTADLIESELEHNQQDTITQYEEEDLESHQETQSMFSSRSHQ